MSVERQTAGCSFNRSLWFNQQIQVPAIVWFKTVCHADNRPMPKRKPVGESVAFTGLIPLSRLIINDVKTPFGPQMPWGSQSDLVTRVSSFHLGARD